MARNFLSEVFGLIGSQHICRILPSEVNSTRPLFDYFSHLDPQTTDAAMTTKLFQAVMQSEDEFEIWEAARGLVIAQSLLQKRKVARKLPKAILKNVSQDWRRDFFSDSLVALQDHIRFCLQDERPFYAKSLVFVQSSGMGKSRLASRFGETCPMIDFVLRDHHDGYPPADPEILSLLHSGIAGEIRRLVFDSPSKNYNLNSQGYSYRCAEAIWSHSLSVGLLQASCVLCK